MFEVGHVCLQASTSYSSSRQVLEAVESSAAFSEKGREASATPHRPVYPSASRAYGQILRAEGLRGGLYRCAGTPCFLCTCCCRRAGQLHGDAAGTAQSWHSHKLNQDDLSILR